VLGRFDAADAHDCDGYLTSAARLAAMTDMTPADAKAEVARRDDQDLVQAATAGASLDDLRTIAGIAQA
jgi:hypothetical protein